MSDRNIVYIGSKPIMDYCLAVLSSLQDDGSTVHLKARGRAISTAVDVAEDGKMRNVSTISITLKKG
jgi:DNA-binding protein